MKSFVCALLVAQAVLQIANAQCIRTVSGPLISSCANPIISSCGGPCGGPVLNSCGCGGPVNSCSYASPVIAAPVIQSNSVASSLADTLSLLTVSSLLADTLPFGPNVYGVPTGCGCGGLGSCGCGGYGSYYY